MEYLAIIALNMFFRTILRNGFPSFLDWKIDIFLIRINKSKFEMFFLITQL